MKLKTFSGLVPAALMSAGLAACGSSGPDLGQMQHDFDNPSGSGSDQQGLISATAKQEAGASSPVGSIAGGGVPGLALRAQGLPSSFAQLAPRAGGFAAFRDFYDRAMGREQLALGSSASSDCLAQQLTKGASGHESVNGGSVDADFSVSVDLGACGGGLSGSLDVEAKEHIDTTSGQGNASLKYTFHHVCDSSTNECVDGGMAANFTINGRATTTMGTTSGSLNETFIEGWDFTATGIPDAMGAPQTIHFKGAIRSALDAQGTNGTGTANASVDYLVYVHSSSGQEVSYVVSITAMATSTGGMITGDVTVTIKCKDGTLTCSKSTDGSAMCTGTISGQMVSPSWSATDYANIKATSAFKN
jgi:hypothetical protein